MMKYLTFTLFLFTCCLTKSFAQGFFKNAKPLIVWNSGDNKTKTKKLKNGGLLVVKFDGFFVNVNIVFVSTGYTVKNLEETDEWEKMQITEYDFDKDDKSEIIIAYGDKTQLIFKVLIYKISKNGATEIGNIDDGQAYCYFEKNKIVLPFGSGGLFNEYTLTKGKFIQTN